jgi:hypothetical protein
MGLNPLVDKIRTAHPGAYDDMDDAALTKAVLSKYPQYSDMAAPPTSTAANAAPPELQSSLPGGDVPVVGAMTQPFGEILAGLEYDPKFRNDTAAYGVGSAAAVGLPAAAPEGLAVTPAALEAVQAAAKAHPLLAKIITKGLEGAGFSAGLGGLAKLQKLLTASPEK